MPIVGGLDIHRKQITFDYLDTETGQVRRGQVSPADREHLRAWLARFAGRQPAHPSSANAPSWRPANRASQARRCSRSAGETWPRRTCPVSVSR